MGGLRSGVASLGSAFCWTSAGVTWVLALWELVELHVYILCVLHDSEWRHFQTRKFIKKLTTLFFFSINLDLPTSKRKACDLNRQIRQVCTVPTDSTDLLWCLLWIEKPSHLTKQSSVNQLSLNKSWGQVWCQQQRNRIPCWLEGVGLSPYPYCIFFGR